MGGQEENKQFCFTLPQDQYAFCHEVLADYVDKFENYANFKDMV